MNNLQEAYRGRFLSRPNYPLIMGIQICGRLDLDCRLTMGFCDVQIASSTI